MSELIKKVFPYHSKEDTILHLKKQEWTTYYSCQNKYPYLTIQQINAGTGQVRPGQMVIRQERPDPFRPDPDVPAEYSMTVEDYDNYKLIGGSPGHNAPAGQHRTTMEIYDETFVLSNITPQEIVFNAGVWVILENWVKSLGRSAILSDVYVITGSVPDVKDTFIPQVGTNKMTKMNIPTHMFKVVCSKERKPKNAFGKNTIYTACFLYPNIPINPTPENVQPKKYMVTHKMLMELSGFRFFPLIESLYGLRPFTTRIANINQLMPINFILSESLITQMRRAYYYGLLIYSTSLEELEKAWEKCQQHQGEFVHMQYHEEYYLLAKKRIQDNIKLVIPHMSSHNMGFLSSNNSLK